MLNVSNGEHNNDMAAGKPTHWEDTRKQSYAGRRSRRNSFSEDSQVIICVFTHTHTHNVFVNLSQ